DSFGKPRLQTWVYRPMRILLSRAAHADKNFSIALGLLLILAAAEILSASFYYIGRIRAAGNSAQPAIATRERHVPASPAPALTQPGVLPTPTASPAAPSEVDWLIHEAADLRDHGDTTNALGRLHEASERDPKNVSVLEEMAKTYESMQLFDRSNETWRKVQEMGPAAGAAYELADQRLKFGVPTPAPTEADDASASLEAAASSQDVVGGIPDGSTFGLT